MTTWSAWRWMPWTPTRTTWPRLRERWPYILEDEAQDSSQLQEDLLRKLAGEGGNWVRVGDPNQAIYETFTNANPRFLANFLDTPEVESRELPTSGRSCAAHHRRGQLTWWTGRWQATPCPRPARPCAFPTSSPPRPATPRSTRPTSPRAVYLHQKGFRADKDEEEEARKIAEQTWPAGCPITRTGPWPSWCRATRAASPWWRPSARRASPTWSCCRARPPRAAPPMCSTRSWARWPSPIPRGPWPTPTWPGSAPRSRPRSSRGPFELQAQRIRSCPRVEEYLWPALERDWLDTLALGEEPAASEARARAVPVLRPGRGAGSAPWSLPVDQLILTLAQDLFQQARRDRPGPQDRRGAGPAGIPAGERRVGPEAGHGGAQGDRGQRAPLHRPLRRRHRLRPRQAQGRGRGGHPPQGQGPGVGPGLPGLGQQL